MTGKGNGLVGRGRTLLRQNEILVTIYIQTALATLGIGLIGPVLPLYAKSFGVSIFMVGLLVTAVGVARVVLNVPVGRLADRFGRKPQVVVGLALMTFGSLGAALAGSFVQLLVCRVLWGIGMAFTTMGLQMMLADVSGVGNRGRVMSLYQAAFQVGHSLGPAIGGFIAYYLGLKGPFIAYSGVALIATLWAILRLSETGTPRAERPTQATEGDGPKSRSPMKDLLMDSSFLALAFLALSHAMSRTGTNQIMLPILATEQVGINIGQLGLALTLTGVVHLSTTLLGGWVSDRFGRKRALIPGYLLMAISLMVFAVSRSYWLFLLASLVMGLGRGISGSTIAYAADLAPKGHYGSTLGLFHTFNDMGMVVGPLIIGWLADSQGLRAPFYFDAAVLAFAAFCFGLFARETVRRARRKEPPAG